MNDIIESLPASAPIFPVLVPGAPCRPVTLFVEDLTSSRPFQSGLRPPVHFEDQDSAVFKSGDTLINLLRDTEARELIASAPLAGRTAGARSQLTLQVEHVDSAAS